MPNQNKQTISLVHYLADVSDAYSLAESDMHWMNTAISHIRREVRKLNELAKSGKEVTQYHFCELIQHLDMYEYLAENRHDQHAKLAEEYTAKYEASKGGEMDTQSPEE